MRERRCDMWDDDERGRQDDDYFEPPVFPADFWQRRQNRHKDDRTPPTKPNVSDAPPVWRYVAKDWDVGRPLRRVFKWLHRLDFRRYRRRTVLLGLCGH